MTRSTISPPLSTPLYGTPRRPDRPTTGTQRSVISAQLGITPLAWQQHTWDVTGELVTDPDTGDQVPAYQIAVVLAPRRAGKSLLTVVDLLTTTLSGKRRRAWYTAQTRADAAMILRDEWLPIVSTSSLGRLISPRMSNGSESLTVPRAGSVTRLFAPVPAALHGQAGDLVVFDELWSHSLTRGLELQTAARPLMATRPGARMLLESAAGTADSTWLIDWIDKGRAAAAADTGTGICYLEWSADFDGADHDDPAVWLAAHPAVRAPGRTGTITLDWLHAEHDLDRTAFIRNYLNVTDRTAGSGTPLDPTVWAGLAVTAPTRTSMAIGVAVGADQASTALVACHHDGTVATLEVIDYRPATMWAVDRLIELYDRYEVVAIPIDAAGPAGVLVAPLQSAGLPIVDTQLRGATAAAGQFVEAVTAGLIRHVPHPALDMAVAGARRRNVGDGSWLWGRRDTDCDVAPLEAAGLARWGHPAVHGRHATIH